MYNLYAYTWGDLLRLATDIPWVHPNSCNSQKNNLYILGERCFECFPSCQNLCFLVLSFVPQTVLFGALLRAKNRALDRARCYSY